VRRVQESDAYDLAIESPNGQVDWEVGADVVLPAYLSAELRQGGELLARAEVELLLEETFDVDELGGEAVGMNGQVRVRFPAGAVSEAVRVKIEAPSAEALPVASLSGAPFEITAISKNKWQQVSTFSEPIEIEVSYIEGMWDGSEEDLRVYWYDPETMEWKLPLDQSVDPEVNIITVYTDHFTVFDTYNSNWQSAQTPTMNFFQHSAFTGAATFAMPIKVPAGPGGFQPDVSLSYNSQVVDSVSSESQASWIGMG